MPSISGQNCFTRDNKACLGSPIVDDHGPLDTSTPKLLEERDSDNIDQFERAASGLGVTYDKLDSSTGSSARDLVSSSAKQASADTITMKQGSVNSPKMQKPYVKSPTMGQTTLALELTPLLPTAIDDIDRIKSGNEEALETDMHQKRSPYARWTIFITLLLLLGFVSVTLALIASNIELLLNEAITPEIDTVSVLNLTDLGMETHVVGKITVDYDNISNWLYRSVLKVSGLMLGLVTVTSTKTVELFISGPEFSNVHVVDVIPTEMVLNLVNNCVSPIDFFSDTKLIEDEIQKVVDSLLAHKDEPIPLDFEVFLSPLVSSRWLRYKGKRLSILHHLVISPDDTHLPVNITDLKTDFGYNYVSLALKAVIDPLPIDLSINPIEWDVSLLDCEGKPSLLGVWTSEKVNLVPNVPTIVDLAGQVSEIPPELLQRCPNGLSPFNQFTKELFEDNIVHVWVSATKSKMNQENLEPWLYKILTLAVIEIVAPIPENIDLVLNELIHDYAIDSMDVVVPVGESTLDLAFRVDINAMAKIDLPGKTEGFELNATQILSQLTLWLPNGDLPVIQVSVEGGAARMGKSCFKSCFNSVKCLFNDLNFTVLNPELVGSALSTILDNGSLPFYPWLAEIGQTYISLGLLDTKIENLRIGSRTGVLIMKETKNNDTNLLLNRLITSANILIDQIIYVDSSPAQLSLLVDFKATNPVNISFATEEEISIAYLYNKTQVGSVSFQKLEIGRGDEPQDFTALIKIENISKYSSELLSHIISGVPVVLDIHGNAGSLHFAKLIENVQVRNVKIPEIQFAQPESVTKDSSNSEDFFSSEDSPNSDDSKPSHSPFLLSTVIHIWTSEIEITVFNPLFNTEIAVQIVSCRAVYEGELLALVEGSDLILIPPGVYQTPRIPIQISKGLGADILRKAINGELQVEVVANLEARIGSFSSDLIYNGRGLTATIKL